MAHRIYNLDASYWRISGGGLTTSGLFSTGTTAYVLNPGLMTSSTKSSLLTLAQFQAFRQTLTSSFSISPEDQWLVSNWAAIDFGSDFATIRDNYDLFMETQINNLGLSLNPANNDFTTLLVMGRISGGLGGPADYFIPIMIFGSQGTDISVVDGTSPTVGTAISFSNITLTSIRVNWGAATDAITPQASLQYKVVRASSASLLDTVSNAQSNGTTVMDWTANTTTYNNTGLTLNTTYAYAVLVRDSSNNIALYSAQEQATLADTTAPTVGTGIQYSSLSDESVYLSWGQATDNVTAQGSLEYKLVYSTSNNISSVSDAETNGTQVFDYQGVIGQLVEGLTPATSYYFAVIVRDSSNNKSLYSPINVTTLDLTAPTVGTGIQTSNITDISIDLSWGAATDGVTAQSSLEYKVVYSTSNNIGTVANANVNGYLAMDWTADTLNYSVTGLSASTSYYFAVLVKDSAGNTSIYSPVNESTTSALDTTAPTVGTGIQFSNTTDTSMDVAWGVATDDVTSQENLQYKLVSSTIDNLISVSDAELNGNVEMDWTTDTTNYTFTGATPATLYYFAVIVRDEAGNKNLYTQESNSTLDSSPPAVGTGIVTSNVTSESIEFSWGAATDDVTAQPSLEYKVVFSASNNIGTIADAELNGTLIYDWIPNTLSATAFGLSPDTMYYLAVLVRDAAGNTALYPVVNETTASS
jgi:hypothetical protein